MVTSKEQPLDATQNAADHIARKRLAPTRRGDQGEGGWVGTVNALGHGKQLLAWLLLQRSRLLTKGILHPPTNVVGDGG